ncbi:MAG: polysaccharide biosynthesis C-terminal domain-containing protein [Clostridia bacterium]|nr:polysaccharide biosynthesis C-terminal domain-containing protein [Clostridia bacterium]
MRKDIPGQFCRYALPQMLGLLFNSVYFIVDGMFIGNRLGRDAMAAAGVAVPILELLIALSMAITAGSGVLVSVALSQKRHDNANTGMMHAISAAILLGVFIAVMGNLFLNPLSEALGSTSAIHQEVKAYLSIILCFSPFMLLSFLLGGLVRNDGQPLHAMIALTVGSLSNIFLDWLFMYPLNMGISGAALATALGPILSDAILLPHFLLKRGSLHFSRCPIKPRLWSEIFALGLPAFVMEFTIGMITFITNLSIHHLGMGEIGLAAYLLIGYLMLIILTLFLGMAEGLQPVFSFMKGSGDQEGIRAMRRFSLTVFVSIGIACYSLVYFFSPVFYGLFTAGDQALLNFTASHSRAYFSGFVFAGIHILLISYWQATMDTRKAMLVALLRSILLPPIFVLLIPALLGTGWFWYGHSLAETTTVFPAIVLMYRSLRHPREYRRT